ncbi:MAG TPA: class I SAM-dependent methyltransferase [Chloroflexia bacterium]|nr:class I SAM-dependent methyltransferase [Chloroflexia bacterium]
MPEFPPVPASYRFPDRSRYPELEGYSRDDIYRDTFGGGALYLAAEIARRLELHPGQIVLDLGCGQGASSVFLARHYGVQVVALDLWTPASKLNEKFTQEGFRDRIWPLNKDITEKLPFAEDYFDAIFCQNSLNFYGGSHQFLVHLLKHLKPGGLIGVGMETLSAEMSPEMRQHPPAVYNYFLPGTDINVWEGDFSKMHSPGWWENLFRTSGLVEVLECRELEDAEILYEDLVRYQIEHQTDLDDVEISIKQLEYGKNNILAKTLFVLTARKL